MSTRLSHTIESLHEMQSVDLEGADIDNDAVETLADALKLNTSVTKIDDPSQLFDVVNSPGAPLFEFERLLSVLDTSLADEEDMDLTKDLRKLNDFDIGCNNIGVEGAAVFADALKVNTSVTTIDQNGNEIGDESALKENTSVTEIDLSWKCNLASIKRSSYQRASFHPNVT
jgi:hypothetical protein